MTMVFPALRIVESERRFDPLTRRMTDWERGECFFSVAPETEQYVEEILGERFGITPFFLMNLTSDPATWAAVLFTDIIERSDDVTEARGDLADEITFAGYGKAEAGMSNLPIGAMAVKSAAALRSASTRHEVFRKAWNALHDCAPDEQWVAVVDL